MAMWIFAAVAVLVVAIAVVVTFGGKVQCRNCGAYIPARAEICPNCGCSLRELADDAESDTETE